MNHILILCRYDILKRFNYLSQEQMRSSIPNENKPVINKQKQSNRLNAKKYLEYFLHCTQHSHVIILAYNKQNVK